MIFFFIFVTKRKKNMNRRRYRNTALLSSSAETEEGLVVTARLKRWGVRNLNGETYASDSYDGFLKDYYGRGGLNMPLTVQHGQRLEDVIGKVLELTKDEEGLTCKAVVFNDLPWSAPVRRLIEAGVLQGMSDEGYSDDYSIADDGSGLDIKKAAMLAVSLVCTPAELAAKVVRNDIGLTGFEDEGKGRLRQRRARQ